MRPYARTHTRTLKHAHIHYRSRSEEKPEELDAETKALRAGLESMSAFPLVLRFSFCVHLYVCMDVWCFLAVLMRAMWLAYA